MVDDFQSYLWFTGTNSVCRPNFLSHIEFLHHWWCNIFVKSQFFLTLYLMETFPDSLHWHRVSNVFGVVRGSIHQNIAHLSVDSLNTFVTGTFWNLMRTSVHSQMQTRTEKTKKENSGRMECISHIVFYCTRILQSCYVGARCCYAASTPQYYKTETFRKKI